MGDDTDDAAEDERAIELSTIAAIFPELSRHPSYPFCAHIEVPVEPQTPLAVRFPTSVDGAPPIDLAAATNGLKSNPNSKHLDIQAHPEDGNAVTSITLHEIHNLSYLPSLKIGISLPSGYPTERPPRFDIYSSWLPEWRRQELERDRDAIWERLGKEQVVFAYLDHLREAADDGFGLVSGNRTTLDMSADLKVSLLDYDLKAKRRKFELETFECGVCLEPKKGLVCHRLSLCGHVFCVECLQNFYNTCIQEGDIGNVKCMAPRCEDEPRPVPNDSISPTNNRKTRKARTLGPSELLQIPLDQDTVQRYVKLKRKKRLESDRTTIYCPRQWCQGPARSKKASKANADSDSEDEVKEQGPPEPQSYDRNEPDKLPPPSERLAICADCTFAFCKVCKASWHGEYYTCFPRSQFELTAEERASEDYMKLHTQACPTCEAPAQKTHGCNHMICFKCETHFCYLCGAYLERANPYQHYNTKGRECFMRLWELEAGDGGEVGHDFGGFELRLDEAEDEHVDMDIAAAAPAPAPAPAPPPRRNAPPARPALRGGVGGRRRDAGLQRFLEMVQNDEEDEWDSDEMEDEALGLD